MGNEWRTWHNGFLSHSAPHTHLTHRVNVPILGFLLIVFFYSGVIIGVIIIGFLLVFVVVVMIILAYKKSWCCNR